MYLCVSVETQTNNEEAGEQPSSIEEMAPSAETQAGEEPSVNASEGDVKQTDSLDPLGLIPDGVLDNLSSDEIDALASGDQETIARLIGAEEDSSDSEASNSIEPEAESDTPQTKDYQEDATDEGEQPLSEKQKPDDGPTRISLKTLTAEDRKKTAAAVSLFKDGVYDSLPEAIAHVYGVQSQQTPPLKDGQEVDDSSAEESVAEPAAEPLQDLSSELEAALVERAKAIEDFDRTKEYEADDRIKELRLEIRFAEQAQKAEEGRLFEVAAEESRFIEEARSKYSDFHDEESNFYQEAIRERAYRESVDPEFFNTPDWPLRLADEVNARIGKFTTESKGETTEAAAKQTYPGQGIAPPTRPPGQVATGKAGLPFMSVDEALNKVESGEVDVEAILEELNRREAAVA